MEDFSLRWKEKLFIFIYIHYINSLYPLHQQYCGQKSKKIHSEKYIVLISQIVMSTSKSVKMVLPSRHLPTQS